MASERPWLESLAACVPDGLLLVSREGQALWGNPQLCRMLGFTGKLKGAHLRILIPELEALYFLPGAHRLTIETGGGNGRELAVHIAPCAPGIEAAWAIHLRDVTELAELRRRLHARERSYSFLRDNASDLIVRTDAAGIVQWTNEAIGGLLPPGTKLREVLSEESAAELRIEPEPRPVTLKSREGVRPSFLLAGIVRSLRDEGGTAIGFSLLLRDESGRQRLQRFVATHALSAREEEIIGYVVQGYSNLNIATILGLSESGVKFHIRNVLGRAKLATRTELMAHLMES